MHSYMSNLSEGELGGKMGEGAFSVVFEFDPPKNATFYQEKRANCQ